MWGPARISGRKLRALVKGIPLDGALGRRLETPEAIGWTAVEELLAQIVELVYESIRVLVYVNTPKNKRPRIPDRKIPRPTSLVASMAAEPKVKRAATSEEMARFFGGTVQYRPKMTPLERPASCDNPVASPAEVG